MVKEIKQFQEMWLQHVQRLDTNRIPKQALQHNPKGRRNIDFDVLLTVHLSIMLAINQLNAQNLVL